VNQKGIMSEIIIAFVTAISFIFVLPIYYQILTGFGYNILSVIPNGSYVRLVLDAFPLLVMLLILVWLFRPRYQTPGTFG